jgi:hypothetical protein
MAIDFPASPTNGQTFTSGALVYTYDGTKWTAQPAGVTGGTKIEVGNTKAEITDTGSNGTFAVTTEGTQRLSVTTTAVSSTLAVDHPLGAVGTPSITFTGDLDTGIYSPGANSLAISTGGTARATVDSSGRLLVGTNSVFSVGGLNGQNCYSVSSSASWAMALRHSAATDPFGLTIQYSGASPNDTGKEFIYCTDSTGVRFSARSNGGIANYSGNNVNLSDINAKKDIAPADGTWDCLKEWEIVNFRYKDQPDDADLNLGVIAQQVAESCPEVITVFQEAKEATETEPAQEERLGVKDQQMMWMAIKALQEAQLRIEALEAEVTALKAQ